MKEILKDFGLDHEGQFERKDGALSQDALNRDGVGLIAHTLDKRQRDRESKSCSFKDTC